MECRPCMSDAVPVTPEITRFFAKKTVPIVRRDSTSCADPTTRCTHPAHPIIQGALRRGRGWGQVAGNDAARSKRFLRDSPPAEGFSRQRTRQRSAALRLATSPATSSETGSPLAPGQNRVHRRLRCQQLAKGSTALLCNRCGEGARGFTGKGLSGSGSVESASLSDPRLQGLHSCLIGGIDFNVHHEQFRWRRLGPIQ